MITIKKMETDDEKCGKGYVHSKAWHEAYSGIVSDDYLAKMTEEKCAELSFKWPDNTFVALDNDKVIGFLCYFKHEENPAVGEISAIYVLQDYYGTGVGQKLMDKALEELSDCTSMEIRVLKDNPRAISFYKKNGFDESGEEEYLDSLKATAIRMVK